MIGNGRNRKSMAYVENVAAFLEHTLSFGPGVHIYNYVDKPDFDMATLVSSVRERLGKGGGVGIRIPYGIGYFMGLCFDLIARICGRTFPISAIRVKKFCATTQFASSVKECGFSAPITLQDGLQRTVQYEFIEDHSEETLFYSE